MERNPEAKGTMFAETEAQTGLEKEMGFAIAIDGPAGAGKSTIAKQTAGALGFIYVDTGAMYRTIALGLLRAGIDCEDEQALSEALDQMRVELRYQDGVQQMLLNGENVTDLIRSPEVTQMASVSSAKAIVREKLLALQRQLAKDYDVVMDGRDIGTRILPDAELKIFMTASAEVRAKRRFLEMQEKGEACSYEEILRQIEERDERDTNREVSPLRRAEDAVELDTSDMTIEEVVKKVAELAEKARERTAG